MATNYYVATDGDDQNDGITGDVATVAKALELIRAARTGAETEPFACNIRAGIYDEAIAVVVGDSGTVEAPLIIKGVSDADRPVFAGSVPLPSGGWSEVTGGDLALFKPSAAGKIFEYDISGVAGVVGFTQAPTGSLTPGGNELFIDGTSAKYSRWPNDEWATVASIDSVTAAPNLVLTSDGPTGQETVTFTGTPWAQGFWQYDWINEAQEIIAINGDEYELVDEHSYGYKVGARMSVTNSLYETDSNFEYAINNTTLKLYVFLDNANPSAYNMTLSQSPDVLLGINAVDNLLVKDIILRECRNSAVLLEYGENVTFDNVALNGVQNGAFKNRDGLNYLIQNCDIDDIGTGIIQTVAGRTDLVSCGHRFLSNSITNFGRHITSTKHAINIDSVGLLIEGNTLDRGPSTAISVIGNDNTIRGNQISNFGSETDDVGGIYIGGDWYGRGNIFEDNTLYADVGTHPITGDVSAIYLDDMASGTTVRNNTIHDIYRGILVGGGRDNEVHSNEISDTTQNIHMDGRGIRWEEMGTEGVIIARNEALRDELLYDTAAEQRWYAAYPPLETLWTDYYLAPEDNTIIDNFTAGTGDIDITEQAEPYTDTNDWFTTMTTLSAADPSNIPTASSVTINCTSDSNAGKIYSLVKDTEFTGSEEDQKQETITNGVEQEPVAGVNTATVDGLLPSKPYYVRWVQDPDPNPYGDRFAMEITTTSAFTIKCGNAGYVWDATVYWGDGEEDAITLWSQAELTHTYPGAGTYIIEIEGPFPWISFLNVGDVAKIDRILQLGSSCAWRNFEGAFYGANNATELTTGVCVPPQQWMANQMFRNWDACVNPPNLTGLDTSECIDMTQMFFRWFAMTSAPDMSGFDMVKVTSVNYMCREWTSALLCDPKISGWNISNIENWTGFFQQSSLSTAAYDDIILAWSTQDWANTSDVDFGGSTYTAGGAVETQRTIMEDKIIANGFTLKDGGPA